MKINNCIVVVGKISSGKSTLAGEISEKLDIPIISFGKYLVEYATKNNLPISRLDLQNLGEKFIIENPNEFLYNVLSSYGAIPQTIIIEGVRHLTIFKLLKELSIISTFIFIDAVPEVRYSRFNSRMKSSDTRVSYEQFIALDNHTVESQIDSLSSMCDFIYNDNTQKSELYKSLKTRHKF